MNLLKSIEEGVKILLVIGAIALVIFAMPTQATFF
jgi:hypothetical protein